MIELNHIFFAGDEVSKDISPTVSWQKPAKDTKPRTAFSRGSRSIRAVPAEPLSPFLRLVLEENGLDPSCYQTRALNRRLAACLRALRMPCESEAVAALRHNPGLARPCLSTLLIGVSSFFRDPAVFEHLRTSILPELMTRKGGVRVLSAGCSAGQELYSVGMILDELGGLEKSVLLGVDCRAEAIEQAGSGCFCAAQLKGLEEERRRRYFRIEAQRAFVTARLRRALAWQVADFRLFPEARSWDLILFRNAGIYLEPAHANALWRRLGRLLQPGGVLMTGKAEHPPADLGWSRESPGLYRKPLAETL